MEPSETTESLLEDWPEAIEAVRDDKLGEAFVWLSSEPSLRPQLLHCLWTEGHVDQARLVSLLIPAWQGPTQPRLALRQRAWLAMFKAAGFIGFDATTGRAIPPPLTTLTIFRGASERGRHGMSWTQDLEIARDFAARYEGSVFRAAIDPRAVLAVLVDIAESEVVVNPHMIRRRTEFLEMADSAQMEERRRRQGTVFGS